MEYLSSEAKKVSLIRKFIDKVKLSRYDTEYRKTISSLQKHPRFSAYKADYVKFLSHLMCEKDSDMCVFFADGDNLRVANEIADEKAKEINIETARKLNLPSESFLQEPVKGEELVDKDIESILLQIKGINQKYGYSNSLVGINGDEIFIVIPHIKEEDKRKIYDEYCKTSSGLITISVRIF